MNKAKVLFYLRRRVKDADARAETDHKDYAERGMSYAERSVKEKAAAEHRDEADALRAALRCVEEFYPDERTGDGDAQKR